MFAHPTEFALWHGAAVLCGEGHLNQQQGDHQASAIDSNSSNDLQILIDPPSYTVIMYSCSLTCIPLTLAVHDHVVKNKGLLQNMSVVR